MRNAVHRKLVKTNNPKLHHSKRILGFITGIILFYAPFAALARVATLIFPNTSIAHVYGDVHQACLRMPIGWIVQPWLLPMFIRNPLYLIGIIALPLSAFFFGPIFCGWLCPAGGFPEYFSRLIPDQAKFDLSKHLDIVPLRYGFFAGLIIAPFVTGTFCCSLCNFNTMQNIVSASLGNFSGFAYWSTTGILSLFLWLFLLGMFTKGGRGWCNFLCPAGALQGLFNQWGIRYSWTYKVRRDPSKCTNCQSCQDICPTRSIRYNADEVQINQYICNSCLDCVANCPSQALSYEKGARREK